MGFGSESKRSSKQQQNPKIAREKSQLPQANLRLKNQGKLKAKNGIGLPFSEEGQDQIYSSFIHTKSSGDCQGQPHKGNSTKEDELVKYMSNLPRYLQRVDSGENLQEKAFNVGVLDWARLEKWKYNRKHIPTTTGNDVSSTKTISSMKTNTKSSALSNAVPKVAAADKSKKHQSTCSSLSSSHKDGLSRGAKPSAQKVRHFQDIETASKSTLDRQKKTSENYKSFGTGYTDVSLDKEKKKDLIQKITSEMGNMSSNMRKHGVSPPSKETVSVSDDEAKNRVEKRQDTEVNKKDQDKKNTSDVETYSSVSRDYDVPLGSRKTLIVESDKTKKKGSQGSEIGLAHLIAPGERKNVMLLPRSARNSFYEEPQELLDGTSNKESRNSFSYDFLQKIRCGEASSEVPHSCPLPTGVEMNSETQGAELSFDASRESGCSNSSKSLRSEGKCPLESKIKSQDAHVETLKILEEEMAELANRNGRTASPNRRFSFSLSRMSRSFSFKESSAVPLLSSNHVSVKSGPVRSGSSGFLDDTNREKVNGHNRTRSSPLRRMLDPLLKSRGLNSFRFTDTIQPSKSSLNPSTPRPVNSNVSLQEEKFESSMIPALLQLTVKNGLPLFRFVVDNGSNMLATSMKSLQSSAKGASDQKYIFSSVSEIKKKSSSWINPGNKEKNCGFIYNIIGQMKISNSHISDLTKQDSSNRHFVKESVLFGMEQRQADQTSAKFAPNTELAAIVIKIPGESFDVKLGDEDILKKGFTECLDMDGSSCSSAENASLNSTTVILPGGVHSLPNKGIPSPLIDRWKSGGLCDCGGWDVGCKLRILSNENRKFCRLSRTCQACLNPNRLELYTEGEAQQNRPIFSLVPHKNGIYAIEFSSSITALQAFFISVTVISCQNSSDLPEFSNLPEGKDIKDTMLNGSHGREKKPTIVLANMPAKYAPNPPHSPVGRV